MKPGSALMKELASLVAQPDEIEIEHFE